MGRSVRALFLVAGMLMAAAPAPAADLEAAGPLFPPPSPGEVAGTETVVWQEDFNDGAADGSVTGWWGIRSKCGSYTMPWRLSYHRPDSCSIAGSGSGTARLNVPAHLAENPRLRFGYQVAYTPPEEPVYCIPEDPCPDTYIGDQLSLSVAYRASGESWYAGCAIVGNKGWLTCEIDLRTHVGKSVELVFSASTWSGLTRDGTGWFVDDVRVVDVTSAPSAPTAFTASATGGHSVALAWEAPATDGHSPVTGYRVFVGGTAVAELPADARNHTVTGLAQDTSYTFAVAALNAFGEGLRATASATTDLTAPTPPTNLTAAPGPANGEITLAWSSPIDDHGFPVVGYRVWRNGAEVAVLGVVGTWTDTGRSPDVTYRYEVAGENSEGVGRRAAVSGMTFGKPSAPRDVHVARGPGTGVTVTWTPPANDGGRPVEAYVVSESRSGGPRTFLAETAETTFVRDGLGPDELVRYYVAARNSVGTGTTGFGEGRAPRNPARVDDVSATLPGALGEARLAWSEPGDDGGSAVTGYVVRRYAPGGSGSAPYELRYDDRSAERHVVLDESGEYIVEQFWLSVVPSEARLVIRGRAVNCGPSPHTSAQIYVTVNSAGFLLRACSRLTEGEVAAVSIPPSALKAGQNTVYLRPYYGAIAYAFDSDTASGISGRVDGAYVYGQPMIGLVVPVAATLESETVVTSTEHLDAGLARRDYYYTVTASNAVNVSEESPLLVVRPPGPPSTVAALATTRGPGRGEVTLAWQPPADDGGSPLLGYRVWRDGALVADVATLGWTDAGLADGQTATYDVRAYNSLAEGDAATVAGRAPEVSGPVTNLTAAPGPALGQIRLAWGLPRDDGGVAPTGYVVRRTDPDGTVRTFAASGRTFQDSGLPDAASVRYEVAAVNVAGEGATAEVTGRTWARVAPEPPIILSARYKTTEPREIKIVWAPPPANDGPPATKYRVYRKFDLYGTEVVAAEVTTLSFADRPPVPAMDYTYRVVALNAVGPGASSNAEPARYLR